MLWFLYALSILLIGAKLFGVVAISWFWALSPALAAFGFTIFCLAMVVLAKILE